MKNDPFKNPVAFEMEALFEEACIESMFADNCGPTSFMGSECARICTKNTVVMSQRI